MASFPNPPPARRGSVALRHPLFWVCLVLLAVNDHLLKGAGLLPEWLTGKLSDFTGLLVAPVLAAALLSACRRSLRLAAFAMPVLSFVAIKVSPEAAGAFEAAMGAAGVPWRIWTDPTDLVALLVLPVAFRLSETGAVGGRRTVAVARRPWLERAAVLAGAVACVATSRPDNGGGGTWTTDAFVFNQAGAIDLRVRWVTGTIDCDLAESRVAETFSRDAFDEGVTFHLEQGDTIPLDRTAAAAASGFEAELPASSSMCDAVLLQVEGMPNTVAFWQRGANRSIQPNIPVGVAPDDGAVMLQRVANDEGMPIGATTTEGIVATDLVERLEPEECLAAGTGSTFAWSETAQGTGTVRISSLDRGPDGCYAMTLSDLSEELPSFFFVCVPSDAFPFEAGDTIDISHLTTVDQRSLRLTRAGSAGRPRVELLVYSGVTGIDTGTVTGTMVDTECVGDRLACGGFAIPGAFRVTTSGDAQTIVTGGSEEVVVPGSRVTVMVGRVERIVLAHPDCTVGRDTLGIRGDVLILTEED